MKKKTWLGTVMGMTMIAACAAPADDAAIAPADEGLDPAQIVYSTNADGTWSEDATQPILDNYMSPTYVAGGASFAGPAGKTRAMGVCLLQRTSTTCSGADAIDPTTGYTGPCAAIAIPAGGYRYCTNINGGTTKYCAIRAGTQADWCAGSPALPPVNGFPQKVAPGSYATPWVDGLYGQAYISYACFEGCKGLSTEPSSSSAQRVKMSQYCVKNPFDPNC